MIPYKDWAPTHYDTKGLNLPEHQDWLVVGFMVTRDSDLLEQSNFEVLERELSKRARDEDWTTEEFNHWACGWFRICLVRPDSVAHTVALQLSSRLDDYAILDEDHLADMEYAADNLIHVY